MASFLERQRPARPARPQQSGLRGKPYSSKGGSRRLTPALRLFGSKANSRAGWLYADRIADLTLEIPCFSVRVTPLKQGKSRRKNLGSVHGRGVISGAFGGPLPAMVDVGVVTAVRG
jgi:hypothetical protein